MGRRAPSAVKQLHCSEVHEIAKLRDRGVDWGGKSGTLGSQQQWMETLHWQTQHFRQEHREAQILASKSKKLRFEEILRDRKNHGLTP